MGLDLGARNRSPRREISDLRFPRPAFVSPLHLPFPSLPSGTWEQQPRPTPAYHALTETTMSCSLPPEMLDQVVDQLHDDSTTLEICSLVSKSWIQRARKHLFANVSFNAAHPGVESWNDTFLNPTSSPDHRTQALSICQPHFIGASDTILTFCNVERLDVITRKSHDTWVYLVQFRRSFPILRSLLPRLRELRSHLFLSPSRGFDVRCSWPWM